MQHTTDILIAIEGTRNNSDDNNGKFPKMVDLIVTLVQSK